MDNNLDNHENLLGSNGRASSQQEALWREMQHPRELGMGYRPLSDSLLLQDLPSLDSLSSNLSTPIGNLGMSITSTNNFANNNVSVSSDWRGANCLQQHITRDSQPLLPPPHQDMYQQQPYTQRIEHRMEREQQHQQSQMASLQMRDFESVGRQRRSRRGRSQHNNRSGHIQVSIPEMSAYTSDASDANFSRAQFGEVGTVRTAVHPYARGRVIGNSRDSHAEKRQPYRAQSDSVLLDVKNLEESSLIDIVCQVAKRVLLESRKPKIDSDYHYLGSNNNDNLSNADDVTSLKAVELANSLRSKLGVHLLSHVRDVFGGLLNLLERRPDTFEVVRIPKNDHVVLVRSHGEQKTHDVSTNSRSTIEYNDERLSSGPPGFLGRHNGSPLYGFPERASPPVDSLISTDESEAFPGPSRGGLEELLLRPDGNSRTEEELFDSTLFKGLTLSNIDEKHPAFS